MDRVRFITHKGQQVLFIDMSGLHEGECIVVMDEVVKVVTAQPKNSVLTLTDWAGCEPGRKDFARIKEAAVYDRPFVKRAAFINGDQIPKVYQQNLKNFSQRLFAQAATKEEALDWLVGETPVS